LPRAAAWLLLLALAAAPPALRGEEETPPVDPRLRRALVGSLLFPGLGQLREKQYAKAALLASAEAACLALAVIHARRGDAAYRRYGAAGSLADAVRWRRETERHDRRRNVTIAAAAGVWALNMADILVTTKKRYGRKRSLAFHPFYDPEHHAYGAGVACSF